jgi:predicted nucleic acid-binding protein
MTRIVIDANIAIGWFGPAVNAASDAALDALSEDGALVPALWRWEVQDVLRRLADGGHLRLSAEAALAAMRQLPIAVDDDVPGLFGDALALAKQYDLTVYDASYLEIALRRRLPLATIDKRLAAAAKRAGAACKA